LLLIPTTFRLIPTLRLPSELSGRLDQALETALKALDLSPNHADLYSNLGVIQHERGEWREAEEALSLIP